MKRPRILVLCSRFPEPPIGGERLRIFRICRELAKHARLDLLTFCETETERSAPSESGMFESITRIDLDTTGQVPGIDQATFQKAAEGAKEGCPVSTALKGNVDIQLDAKLTS